MMSNPTSLPGDLSGPWLSCYWFPSNTHAGVDTSQYELTGTRIDEELILQSRLARPAANMLVRLAVDEPYVSGTWLEQTDANGEFKGKIYSGMLELIIAHDRRTMAGQWIGTGTDLATGQPGVYGGRWELSRPEN